MKTINHSKNSIYTFLSWLLPLGLTFFATPYIVRGLGTVEYGLYALMLGFIAYSLSFNIGRAVTKYVIEFNASGETENVTKIISATFFLGLTIGTGGAAILFLGADFLVRNILSIENSLADKAVTGLHLVAVSIWFLIIGQVFVAIIQAVHRFDVYSFITTLTNIFFITGNVFLVWSGHDFLYLLGWNIVTNCVNAVSFLLYARKLQPGTAITLNFGREMLWLTIKYGLSIAGYQLFSNILFIFERVVIIRIEGTSNLTNYVLPMTLGVYLHSFIGSLAMNLMPYSSELFARKQILELEIIYKRISKIVVALVIFMVVSMAVGGRVFLTNWIDANFAEASYQVFIVQLVTFGMLAILIISWQFIEGYGLPYYNTISGFSWMIIAAPLMPWLTMHYGILGTSFARFIGGLTIPITICLIEKKIFGKFIFGFWLRVLVSVGVCGLAVGALEFFLLRELPVNWFSFIGVISLCGIIFACGLLLTSYFSSEEKKWLKNLFKKSFA